MKAKNFHWQLYWPAWWRLWPTYDWSIEQYNNFVYVDNVAGFSAFQCRWRSGFLTVQI